MELPQKGERRATETTADMGPLTQDHPIPTGWKEVQSNSRKDGLMVKVSA